MKLATLCYLKQAGKTLMLFRNKKPNDVHEGKWNGLGGKFEPGETPEECARREIFEESGLRVASLEMKGVLTFPMFSQGEDWYVFVFVSQEISGEMQPSTEGTLAWIPDHELLDLPLWEGDRMFLPWLSRPVFFSGRFLYVSGQLQEHSADFYPSIQTL
jgi:8-oxo-dGTP diphosphatase